MEPGRCCGLGVKDVRVAGAGLVPAGQERCRAGRFQLNPPPTPKHMHISKMTLPPSCHCSRKSWEGSRGSCLRREASLEEADACGDL